MEEAACSKPTPPRRGAHKRLERAQGVATPSPPTRVTHKRLVRNRPSAATTSDAIDRHRHNTSFGRLNLTLGTSTTYFTGECSPALIVEVRASSKCPGALHRTIGLQLYEYAATHDTSNGELNMMSADMISKMTSSS